LGLVVGKALGISLFSWLAVRSGLARLPAGVSWGLLAGAACLGGIGFTMSLFIAGLALPDATLLEESKIGILIGSTIAGTVGFALLLRARKAL
jgi:NhaA family Na+:H+ antiporter